MNGIKRIIKMILPEYIIELLKKVRLEFKLISSIKVTIVNPHDVGEIVKTVKEETVETMAFQKAYNLVESGRVNYKSSKLDLMKYTNATVFISSDFILCQDRVVWHKFSVAQFTKIFPVDFDLIKRENNNLFIRKPKNTVNVKIGFSLCGVASIAWAHFLVQYLPKLYLLPELLDITKQKITVILPNYTDPQVREIVYFYLNNLNKIYGIEILELKNNDVARCEILYHIDNTAWLSECIQYTSPIDGIIPEFVADSLKNNLLADLSKIDKEGNNIKYPLCDKLFIARSGFRNLVNYEEVENYFKQKGYLVVSPDKVSLSEKFRLFKNASFVVGPLSSGFTNLIFCKKGTKVLMMMNFQKLFEPYSGFIADQFDIDITNICGFDENSTDFNSSFTIPLNKIISACNELGF